MLRHKPIGRIGDFLYRAVRTEGSVNYKILISKKARGFNFFWGTGMLSILFWWKA